MKVNKKIAGIIIAILAILLIGFVVIKAGSSGSNNKRVEVTSSSASSRKPKSEKPTKQANNSNSHVSAESRSTTEASQSSQTDSNQKQTATAPANGEQTQPDRSAQASGQSVVATKPSETQVTDVTETSTSSPIQAVKQTEAQIHNVANVISAQKKAAQLAQAQQAKTVAMNNTAAKGNKTGSLAGDTATRVASGDLSTTQKQASESSTQATSTKGAFSASSSSTHKSVTQDNDANASSEVKVTSESEDANSDGTKTSGKTDTKNNSNDGKQSVTATPKSQPAATSDGDTNSETPAKDSDNDASTGVDGDATDANSATADADNTTENEPQSDGTETTDEKNQATSDTPSETQDPDSDVTVGENSSSSDGSTTTADSGNTTTGGLDVDSTTTSQTPPENKILAATLPKGDTDYTLTAMSTGVKTTVHTDASGYFTTRQLTGDHYRITGDGEDVSFNFPQENYLTDLQVNKGGLTAGKVAKYGQAEIDYQPSVRYIDDDRYIGNVDSENHYVELDSSLDIQVGDVIAAVTPEHPRGLLMIVDSVQQPIVSDGRMKSLGDSWLVVHVVDPAINTVVRQINSHGDYKFSLPSIKKTEGPFSAGIEFKDTAFVANVDFSNGNLQVHNFYLKTTPQFIQSISLSKSTSLSIGDDVTTPTVPLFGIFAVSPKPAFDVTGSVGSGDVLSEKIGIGLPIQVGFKENKPYVTGKTKPIVEFKAQLNKASASLKASIGLKGIFSFGEGVLRFATLKTATELDGTFTPTFETVAAFGGTTSENHDDGGLLKLKVEDTPLVVSAEFKVVPWGFKRWADQIPGIPVSKPIIKPVTLYQTKEIKLRADSNEFTPGHAITIRDTEGDKDAVTALEDNDFLVSENGVPLKGASIRNNHDGTLSLYLPDNYNGGKLHVAGYQNGLLEIFMNVLATGDFTFKPVQTTTDASSDSKNKTDVSSDGKNTTDTSTTQPTDASTTTTPSDTDTSAADSDPYVIGIASNALHFVQSAENAKKTVIPVKFQEVKEISTQDYKFLNAHYASGSNHAASSLNTYIKNKLLNEVRYFMGTDWMASNGYTNIPTDNTLPYEYTAGGTLRDMFITEYSYIDDDGNAQSTMIYVMGNPDAYINNGYVQKQHDASMITFNNGKIASASLNMATGALDYKNGALPRAATFQDTTRLSVAQIVQAGSLSQLQTYLTNFMNLDTDSSENLYYDYFNSHETKSVGAVQELLVAHGKDGKNHWYVCLPEETATSSEGGSGNTNATIQIPDKYISTTYLNLIK